jgi:glycosyltransferase involved in cell wall biosynthesis
LFRLARHLRSERVDTLHTHLFEPSVVGLMAGSLAGTGLRIMTRHYSNYHTRMKKRWHVRMDRLCNRMSHAVIAVSRHTADHLVRTERTPPAKVYTVVNGIDFSRLVSHADRHAQLREQWGVGDGHLLVVPARLHPEKGQTYLFRALPLIRRRLGARLTTLIAGAGPAAASYREEVRTLGCADIVKFVGFRRDLPDLMAAADLVVLPSVAEAFGIAAAEALYLGTPVVASNVGGVPEIVDDGVDGVLVPPADSEALGKEIADLLVDWERRSRFRGIGTAKVEARFGFRRMVRAYEQVYEEVLEQRWPSSR